MKNCLFIYLFIYFLLKEKNLLYMNLKIRHGIQFCGFHFIFISLKHQKIFHGRENAKCLVIQFIPGDVHVEHVFEHRYNLYVRQAPVGRVQAEISVAKPGFAFSQRVKALTGLRLRQRLRHILEYGWQTFDIQVLALSLFLLFPLHSDQIFLFLRSVGYYN